MNEKVTTKKCRTCLKSSTKSIPFTKTVNGITPDITYEQILKDCAQLEFNTVHERNLPQYLCFLCCIQLKSTYVFVQQAQQCNVKLISDLTKQFCLKEQEIDLPQLLDETPVSIKKEISCNSNLEQQDEYNFIANEGNNSDHEDNLVTNEPLIAEPIIEYDSEDKSFTAEPVLTIEQIIEYDFEDNAEMDNDNFTTETNEDKIEGTLSIKIETLDSVETLLDAVQCPVCKKLLARHDKLETHMRIHDEHSETAFCKPLSTQKPLSKEQTFECEKCVCIFNNKGEYLKHLKETHNSGQTAKNSLQKQDAADKKFNCRFCEHVANTYSGLKYHKRAKHSPDYCKIKCNFCSFTTTNLKKIDLMRHIKAVHIELIKSLKTSNTHKNNNVKTNDGFTNNLTTIATDEGNISDKNNEQNEEEISDEDYIRNMLNMKKRSSTKVLHKQDAADKQFNCRFCDHVANTYSGLRYHSRSKHPDDHNKLKCNFCSYSTTSLRKCALLDHIKTVHIELVKYLKTNAISNTNKNDNSKTTDEEDISDNDNDQNKQEISDEDYIRNMLNMKTTASTKALVRRCEDCGRIYANYKSLLAHRLHVHKRKDMFSICPHCNKKCKRETDLKIHIRQMHGPQENRQQPKPRSKEKRFMCEECSYTCTTSTLLNIHFNRHHTGEKPYKCDICSKSFVEPHKLKIHRYTHTGEKPYKCSICLKCFRDPSYWRRHKLLHTNKTPFTCDDCGKGFTQSYNLSLHKRTHLKGNKLSCSVCSKFFKNESMLNIHQINENHYDEVV